MNHSKDNPQSIQDQLKNSLDRLFLSFQDCREGEIATYIPELAKADPNLFGAAIAHVDGSVTEHGDSQKEFTIQSISKPFVFGLALEENGREEVLKRIGVEPSGDAFNSTHLLRSERPFNAMLNAGAIAVTSMVPGKTGDEKFERILDLMSKAAGRQLEVDERVYKSELATGDRNRAIAYLLRGVNVVEQDIEDLLQTYFRQCAIRVTCRDLAIMGATLGNIGINPITGKDVLDLSAVRDVLTVMFTCGMYDFAGEWALKVGVPAKSGVSGGIMAVVNRQLGMGIYSPRLDPMGNSIRGVNLCSKFAEEQGLHLFNFSNVGSTFLEAISKPNTSSD